MAETGQRHVSGMSSRRGDVKNGFHPKTVNLRQMADDPEMLVAKCNSLQADMILWRTGHRAGPNKFDGTVKSLLSIYETHPKAHTGNSSPGRFAPTSITCGSCTVTSEQSA